MRAHLGGSFSLGYPCCVLLFAAIAATGPVSLAQVPTSTGSACPLLEGAAAFLGTQRSVWVERAPNPSLLEQAESWARKEPDGGWVRMQQMLQTTYGLTFPLPLRAWASPADGALAAACGADPEVWRRVGAAVTPALVMAARKGPERPRDRISRWIDAVVRLASGGQPDPSALAGFAAELDAHDLPTWSRAASDRSPTLAGVAEDLVILFERGTFVALQAETGRTRWTLDGAVAAPSVTWLNGRPLFNTARGLVQVDPSDGAALSFFAVERPHEEVAASPYGLFLANTDEVWAIEPATGEVRWRRDLSEPITSGPVVSGLHVALPHRTSFSLIRVDTGRVEKTVALFDEVSAPLTTTGPDWTWAFLGTQGLLAFRWPDTRIVHRTPPLQWPTVAAGSSLFALSGSGRGTELWRIDPSDGPERLARGELDLLIRLDPASLVHVDGRGLAARDSEGGIRWRLPLSGRPKALAASSDVLWAATDDEVLRVDHRAGRTLRAIRLDDRSRELGAHATFGVAISERGTVYGLPRISDPRVSALRRFATWMRAQALLGTRSRRSAVPILAELLERYPEDRVAQVLYARARDEAGDWVRLATWAPEGSGLHTEVRAELERRGLQPVEAEPDDGPDLRHSGQWNTPSGIVELGPDFAELPGGIRVELPRPIPRWAHEEAFAFDTDRGLVIVDRTGLVQFERSRSPRAVVLAGPLVLLQPRETDAWLVSGPGPEPERPLPRRLTLHPVALTSGAALASGNRIDLLRFDGSIRTGVTLPARVEQMVALPDDRLAVGLADDTIRLVDPVRRRMGSPLRLPVRSMEASREGKLRLEVDGLVLQWDPAG